MTEVKKIIVPFQEGIIETLKAGDRVVLSGTIYTARDKAHALMVKDYEEKKEFPFDIKNQLIYYVGPTPTKEGEIIGSAGPTTASRMDPFTPFLLDQGLRGTIAKGFRSKEVVEAIKKNKGIYFIAIGGSGALLSKSIKKLDIIAYDHLGTEAIRKLEVEDMPLIVGVDCFGNNIYEINQNMYKDKKYQ